MAHPFFDSTSYPWHRQDARTLHSELWHGYTTAQDLDLLYKASAADLPPLLNDTIDRMWKSALENLTGTGGLRSFCRIVCEAKPARPKVVDAIKVIEQAEDPIRPTLLTGDRVFLDREELRDKLQRLTSDTSLRVLLIRGDADTGKTWTKHLVEEIAKASGEPCFYLFDGNAGTTHEVLELIFGGLGALQRIPEPMGTEDAWFRKICNHLLAIAKESGKKTWVVMDDLGEYETGLRVDGQIRKFFDQFALSMENPEFARWFRLVLIDYPELKEGGEGGVPSKWTDFWEEDRPDVNEVKAPIISKFVLQWAIRKNKQLAPADADKFAADVIAAADAERTKPNPPPLMEAIHKALRQGLRNL
ncbi:MAG TPA: hypothetical protein VHW00_14340 [Thermoanaerobaculia bacterium]|nr:hypothetical protein [Thermoanaerobaculia bacterium]